MPRSLKKGPYVHPSVMKHLRRATPGGRTVIKTWSRSSTITPEMIGFVFGVHNGRAFIEVKVMEDMVGHKFGEFAPTRKFIRHGGKMQRDIEQKGTAPAAAPAPAKK
ncbi:MAG: 30S ribosomal protein S19 [bacterium]|nr:30S ribosomal protein S19 [bacterium]MDZ4299465.1 30S ribosomal protein S19 [Candidatus Sungbacteria bacterium]